MIDDLFELLLDVAVELIPNSVWKFLTFVVGIVSIGAGVMPFNKSTRTSGVLVLVGITLLAGSVMSWYR